MKVKAVFVAILCTLLLASNAVGIALLDATKPAQSDLASTLGTRERETRAKVNEIIDAVATLGTSDFIIKSGDYTAVNGDKIAVDTHLAAVSVTFPASPTAGNYVVIYDARASWSTYNLTLKGNGSNIRGSASNVVISTGPGVAAIYIDSSYGWDIVDFSSGAGSGGSGYGRIYMSSIVGRSLATAVSDHYYDNATLVVDVPVTLSDVAYGGTLSVPANLDIQVERTGSITIPVGVTLLQTKPPIAGNNDYQIYYGSGTVSYSKPITVYPQHWGAKFDGATSGTAALLAAYNSLPTAPGIGTGVSGGVIYLSGGVLKANLNVLKDNVVLLCPESGWLGAESYAQEQGTYIIADDVDSPVIQVGDASHEYVAGFRVKNCTFRGSKIGESNTGKYGLYLYSAYMPEFDHVSLDGFTIENYWQRNAYLATCKDCLIAASNANPSNTVRIETSVGTSTKFVNSWLFGSQCQDDNASKSTYNALCTDNSFYLVKGANYINLDHSVGEVMSSTHGLLFTAALPAMRSSNDSYVEAVGYASGTVIAAEGTAGNTPWGNMFKGEFALLGAYKRANGTIDNDYSYPTDLVSFGSISNDLMENTLRYMNCIAAIEDNDTQKCQAYIKKEDVNRKLYILNREGTIMMQGSGGYYPSVKITGDDESDPGALHIYNPHGPAIYAQTDNNTSVVAESGTACTNCGGLKGISRRGTASMGSTVAGTAASFFLSEDGNGTGLSVDTSASALGRTAYLSGLINATDNAAALTAGVPVGYVYRSGDSLKIAHTAPSVDYNMVDTSSDNSTAMVCGGYYYATTGHKVWQLPTWEVGCRISLRQDNNSTSAYYLTPHTGGVMEPTVKTSLCSANQKLKSAGAVTDAIEVVAGGPAGGVWYTWQFNGNHTCLP